MLKVLCEKETNSWHLNAIEITEEDNGFSFKCPICGKYIKHLINIRKDRQ